MPTAPRWIDSHCHIEEPLQDPAELAGILRRAAEAGVERLVCVGTDLDSSRASVALAERVSTEVADGRRPLVYSTVGLHPHDASDGLEPVAALLEALTGGGAAALAGGTPAGGGRGGSPAAASAGGRLAGSVVGVGECGLDYYYEHSPREAQREVFAAQIRLATRLGLTLVVHTRDAWDETVEILEREGVPPSTIIHCFTGGPAQARRCLDLGAFLSFSGIVTFKNAVELREAARLCPADRLLVETDSPFLAPVPFRGKPNEPAHVAVVGEAVAMLRGVSAGELAETTRVNAERAFALAPARS
ncbi:MAG TPA: TatD family hydrolase [Acidimicrobiales bacterium]|nr:TatD family hydrolase [Acidimicrobiales bacterium]